MEYFWNDPNHKLAGKYEFGEKVTDVFVDSDTDRKGKTVNDPRLKSFLESGKVTTSKPTAKEPKMGEVDSLKAQVATLAGTLKEKITEFDVERAKHNKEGGGSLQSDLDRIAELEGEFDLIEGVINEIKPALNKDEILAKVKEIKALFTEGE